MKSMHHVRFSRVQSGAVLIMVSAARIALGSASYIRNKAASN